MAKKYERILLYQFPSDQIAVMRNVLRAFGIQMQTLPMEAWREKIGFLLGIKGYKSTIIQGKEHFDFPHRVMLLEHIQGKRVAKLLMVLEDAGIPRITYKSAITPYNTLWTLRYLCEHMAKEHGSNIQLISSNPIEGNT